MKTIRTFFLPALLASVFLMGCDADSMNSEEEVDLTLRMQGMFGSQQLISGQTYDHNGANITVTTARVYLSDFVLTTADGQEVTVSTDPVTVPAKDANDNDVTHSVTDKIVLTKHDMGMEYYHFGTVPEGDYTSMSFRVGIVGQDNRIDASQVPASHPLAKQTDKNNHWNWANGYIYLRLDGEVDTDGDGSVDEVWETHIGKENFSRVVSIDTDFTLDHEMGNLLHLMVDYKHFIHMVDLADPTERLSHTGDNLPVANKVASMMDGAFMIHGVHMDEGSHTH